MKAVILASLLLAASVAGCLSSADVNSGPPAISIDYSKSTQTTNGRTTTTVSATITAVNNLSDWSEINVRGCTAPSSGPFDLPHKLRGCGGSLKITHIETGKVLYEYN